MPLLQTPKVFFPRQFFLPRNLLCIHHSSQDAHGPCTQKEPFLFNLCYTNVLLPMLGAAECFLLAGWPTHCVAICDPLHYPLVMCPEVCIGPVVASGSVWCSSPDRPNMPDFLSAFCGSNAINNHFFFCDIPPLLKLACGDTL